MNKLIEESFQMIDLEKEDVITSMDSIQDSENTENSNTPQILVEHGEVEEKLKGRFEYFTSENTGFVNSDAFMNISEPDDCDWVFVPQLETDESDCPQTPLQKQRSKSSSLEKTLSYVITKQPRDYVNKTLEKCIFPSGTGKFELSNPRGLTYEKETDRIFIADTDNNRIQVYSLGSTIFSPTIMERTRSLSTIFISDPKMNRPWGICTSNAHIYVTQYNAHCVDVYTNNRNFVSRFGSRGFGIGKFSNPTGICADGAIVYVCDSNNNRVQILKQHGKELKYVKNFGIWTLKSPRDIKIHKSEIFVLDSGDQCMHIFNENYEHLRSCISNGERGEVDNPQFFEIDDKGNLLISDWLNHAVKVFESSGKKIGEMANASTMTCPLGIAISLGGDVFVADGKPEGYLNIF